MTKVRWVAGFSPAASRLLQHIEHSLHHLPGTQDAHRIMHFDTQAHRIRYGIPICVTFSPDESHNLFMIRVSRTSRNDLVFKSVAYNPERRHSARDAPDLNDNSDDVVVMVSMEDVLQGLPSFDV